MSRLRYSWLLLLLIGSFAAAPAYRPNMSTAPPTDSNLVATIKCTYRPGQTPVEEMEALRVLADMAQRIFDNNPETLSRDWGLRAGGEAHAVVGFDDPQFRILVPENSNKAMTIRLHAGLPRTRTLAQSLGEALEVAVSSGASVPDDQVAQQLAKAQQERIHVGQLQQQIGHLTASRQKVRTEILAEKLKALELEKLRLEMDLASKKARGAALREQMKKIATTATTRAVAGDAVLEQLKQAVEVRATKLERHRTMFNSGVITASELAESEAELLEAKARMAVRQQELAQPLDLELLQKLTQEVTLVAVDTAELAERLQQVIQRLPPDDLSQITAKDLARLTAEYSASETPDGKPLPLAIELQKRQGDIELRMLALRLADVQVIPAPATQPK